MRITLKNTFFYTATTEAFTKRGLKIPVSLVRFRVRAPYLEEPAYGGFFAFWGRDSPSNYVRLFGLATSPCGPTPSVVQPVASDGCPSPGTLFRRTRLWRVFCFLGYGLSIELRSIIRPGGLTLRNNISPPAGLEKSGGPESNITTLAIRTRTSFTASSLARHESIGH